MSEAGSAGTGTVTSQPTATGSSGSSSDGASASSSSSEGAAAGGVTPSVAIGFGSVQFGAYAVTAVLAGLGMTLL